MSQHDGHVIGCQTYREDKGMTWVSLGVLLGVVWRGASAVSPFRYTCSQSAVAGWAPGLIEA